MKNTTPEVTTHPFERSHGRRPRGFGSWAFAPSRTVAGFDRDVDFDRVVVVSATFAEARRMAANELRGFAPFMAVLP